MRRITETKRKAMVALFLAGWSFKEVARLFRVRTRDAEQVVREWNNRR